MAKRVPADASDQQAFLDTVEGWLEDDDPCFAAIVKQRLECELLACDPEEESQIARAAGLLSARRPVPGFDAAGGV